MPTVLQRTTIAGRNPTIDARGIAKVAQRNDILEITNGIRERCAALSIAAFVARFRGFRSVRLYRQWRRPRNPLGPIGWIACRS